LSSAEGPSGERGRDSVLAPPNSAAAQARPDRWPRLGLGVLLAAYLLLAGTYNFVNPIFEGPDEIWHYLYVRHLAAGQGLPHEVTWTSLLSIREAGEPPLYYAVGALLTFWAPREDLAAITQNNFAGSIGDPTSQGNKNHFLHPPDQGFPWTGEVLTVHLVRLTSTLWGALTVFLTYMIGRAIFRSATTALAAAAALAFDPQFLFMTAAVDNDIAAGAMAALLLWLSVRAIRRPPDRRTAAMLGVVAGLVILAKPIAAGAAVVAVVALFGSARRTVAPWPSLLRSLAVMAGATALTCGWWFGYNLASYGSLFPLSPFLNGRKLFDQLPSLQDVLTGLPGLWRSYWAVFGWFSILVPEPYYHVFDALGLLALIGVVVAAARRRAPPRSPLLAEEGTGGWEGDVPALKGRSRDEGLKPQGDDRDGRGDPGGGGWTAGPPLPSGLASASLSPAGEGGGEEPFRSPSVGVGTEGGAFRNRTAAAPGTGTPPPSALPGDGEGAGREGRPSPSPSPGGRGKRLSPAAERGGETIPAPGSQSPTPNPASVYWPGVGLAALLVAAVFGGVLAYRLIVLDFQGRLMLGAASGFGLLLALGWSSLAPRRLGPPLSLVLALSLVVPAAILPWTVIRPAYLPPPRLTAAVHPAQPFDVRFGDGIQLVGADLALQPGPTAGTAGGPTQSTETDATSAVVPRVHPGDLLTVTLYLQATRPLRADDALFLKLDDAQAQTLVGLDTYPGHGTWPTSYWQPGQVLVDRYQLRVPPTARGPQVGQLLLGFYPPATHRDLPAVDAAGHRLGTSVTLSRVVLAGPVDLTQAGQGPGFRVGNAAAIGLVASHLDRTTVAPGGILSGWLLYGDRAPVGRDYQIFIHLVGPHGLLAQADGPPAGGAYPTGFWQPGDLIRHSFRVTIPPTAPAGPYRLDTGWYDLQTLQRLPTTTGDSLPLGTIHVTPAR
jgi:hypothetical protein